jgi:hypothetical protein
MDTTMPWSLSLSADDRGTVPDMPTKYTQYTVRSTLQTMLPRNSGQHFIAPRRMQQAIAVPRKCLSRPRSSAEVPLQGGASSGDTMCRGGQRMTAWPCDDAILAGNCKFAAAKLNPHVGLHTGRWM